MKKLYVALLAVIGLNLSNVASCAPETIATVAQLDLPRYMGRWFVIAHIPSLWDKDGYAQVESYRLETDGTVAVTFTQHKGSFEGPLKTMHPRGFIKDTSNANWGVRLIWPVKSEYRVSYIDEAYTQVIIGRSKRDYVWIMARTPTIPEADFDRLVERVKSLGYDTTLLRKVPQIDTGGVPVAFATP